MGRWSAWLPLYHDDGSNLRPNEIKFEGPGAFIVAVSRGRRKRHTLFVGFTDDLKTKLYGHGNDGTWKALQRVWENGYKVWYYIHTTQTARNAKRLDRNTRSRWWLFPLNMNGGPTQKRSSS